MNDIVYYNDLYDLYGLLLTDKQRKYFEDYYFHNLSFSEIAENYGISRNAAFNQVHIVVQKLEEYETKLELFKKKNQLLSISKHISDEVLKEQLESLF